MNEIHFRKLERMYLSTNVNQQFYQTTKVTIGEGTATIDLTIEEKYFHALGAIHGSVYFKLLDDAAFFAVNSLIDDVFALTTSFNLNLIRPANRGQLIAIGNIRYQSKNIFTAESKIINEVGKEIAFGTGNFAKSKVPLSPEIGYHL